MLCCVYSELRAISDRRETTLTINPL